MLRVYINYMLIYINNTLTNINVRNSFQIPGFTEILLFLLNICHIEFPYKKSVDSKDFPSKIIFFHPHS